MLSRLLELNEKRERSERAVADARAKLAGRQLLLTGKIRELRPLAAKRAELEAQLSAVTQKVSKVLELEAEREQARGEIQTLSGTVTRLETVNAQLRAEMESIKERVDQLEAASAACPLCGQDLSAEHRESVIEGLQKDGKQRGEQFRANRRTVEDARKDQERLTERIRALDVEIRGQTDLRRQEGKLEQAVGEAVAADQQLPALEQESADLRACLEDGSFAAEDRARLDEAQALIAKLGYNLEAHQAVKREIETLAHFEAEKREQESALRHVEEEQAALKVLRATAERDGRRLAKDEGERDKLSQEVEALPQVLVQLRETGARVESLRGEEAEARLLLGAARQKLEHCDYLAREREIILKREQQAIEEKGIYEELRLAFGKKGLQAMIIEAAMPEIEDEANALLSRMTDSRMHVRFDTQRETLKGDVVETLDINISDELGPRSYELYSGGEAFRINFAIRIALSKLLARRAGAELQTLVIDEGFGTQDAQGRERLVEAINTIRDDFARILVITHVEELRDAFPTRIDVVKTVRGSNVYVGG